MRCQAEDCPVRMGRDCPCETALVNDDAYDALDELYYDDEDYPRD